LKNKSLTAYLIDKVIHSVLTVCQQCGGHGVNIPFNNQCANCGYAECLTYYDSETIDKYLMVKKKHGGARKGAGRPITKESTVVIRVPVSKIEAVRKILSK